jgi:predicted small metal-binding protein
VRCSEGCSEGDDVKTHLNCPCGEAIRGKDEDELVELAQAHLAEAHPAMKYEREHILFMAY